MSVSKAQLAPAALESRRNTRGRVLSAASRILQGEGYSRLTMERVAAESGAAKTTIYRWWPTKAALCMDLYLEVAGRELRDPNTGNVENDLRQVANTVVRLQTRTVAGQAFVGLLAEAQLDPQIRKTVLAPFADRRRQITRQVLRRAVDRGELRSDTEIDLVIDALGGAMTFRLLQGHAPLSAKFTEALVKLVLQGCSNSVRAKHASETTEG